MGYWGFPKYVSVADKKAKAEKKLKQLRKKNPRIKPVEIKGKAIATTWWGKEWNFNLERYADYSNRIGRGRSYVRHSAVLDLQIKSGKVESLVMGSSSKPYAVVIKIKPIPKKNWKEIKRKCMNKLGSLQKLLAGKFPKALGEVFTAGKEGLFPSPDEIEFSCSCPDWASMCKHVAATLYGTGARLDEKPDLFFKLRNVDVNDLISEAVKDSAKGLLKKAETKTKKVIEDSDLSDIFGIDLDDDKIIDIPKVRSPKTKYTTKAGKKKSGKKATKKTVKKAVKTTGKKKKLTGSIKSNPSKKSPIKKKIQKPKQDMTIGETVEKIIKRRKKGINIPQLIKLTNYDEKKVRNAVSRLKSQGRIQNISRGVYTAINPKN